MPSPIAHSVSGYVISKFFLLSGKKNPLSSNLNTNLLYTIFVANSADLDFLLELFTDTKYHRGFTHSIVFALGFSVVFVYIFSKPWSKQLFSLTLLLYGSHLLLDFFTSGGKGMQLLWPFSDSYFKSSIEIFPSVHHSRGLFALSHFHFIIFELAYSILLYLGLSMWRRTSRKLN